MFSLRSLRDIPSRLLINIGGSRLCFGFLCSSIARDEVCGVVFGRSCFQISNIHLKPITIYESSPKPITIYERESHCEISSIRWPAIATNVVHKGAVRLMSHDHRPRYSQLIIQKSGEGLREPNKLTACLAHQPLPEIHGIDLRRLALRCQSIRSSIFLPAI